MEINNYKVGDIFIVDPNYELSKFKHKDASIGSTATSLCLFDQDKYIGHGGLFKLVHIVYKRSIKNLFKKEVRFYVFKCTSVDKETCIDRDYRMAKNRFGCNCRKSMPINRSGEKMEKPKKILKCYHEEEPCHTNLCPKFKNMDKYKNGTCHVDDCEAFKKYVNCIHPDNFKCPECGERIR